MASNKDIGSNNENGASNEKAEKRDSDKAQKEGVNEKSDEYMELKERFMRLAAEFDNYKKRTANDIASAKRMGMAELMKPLLSVLDEFELTLIAVNAAKNDSLAKGVEMLYSNFTDTLKSFGLMEVEADGAFDPYRHEIMLAREDDSKPGTILEVVKKGYMLDGKLLRPASVIVAKERERNDDDTKGGMEQK